MIWVVPMVRAAPLLPARSEEDLPANGFDAAGLMGGVLAELAQAFTFDLDAADVQDEEAKWPMGRTMAFVAMSSAALWVLILYIVSVI